MHLPCETRGATCFVPDCPDEEDRWCDGPGEEDTSFICGQRMLISNLSEEKISDKVAEQSPCVAANKMDHHRMQFYQVANKNKHMLQCDKL